MRIPAENRQRTLRGGDKKSGRRIGRPEWVHEDLARKGYLTVTAPFGAISTPETSVPPRPESVPTETQ